jgi:hypothetical protein
MLLVMELRDRIFGPIHVESEQESSGRRVDFGNFIRKLILSEQVILEAGLLEDFPLLIAKFGYDGMAELLKSGRLRIVADFFTATNTGQIEILDSRRAKGILPLGSYSLDVLALHDLKEHVSGGMSAIKDVPALSEKQSRRLRKLIAERLLSLPADKGTRAIKQANQDIATNPLLVKRAISVGAKSQFQLEVAPDAFDFAAEFLDDSDFRTETNLGDVLGLDAETTHKVVERGLLGVAGLAQRVEYMERFQAVTGFKVELDLFEEKLGFLARRLDPDASYKRFDRVVELLDLPDVDPDPESVT